MNDQKTIQLPESKKTKEIKPKEKIKRMIVDKPSWNVIKDQMQSAFLSNPTPLFLQQIKKKLASYKCQDIEKGITDTPIIDLSATLQKLDDCSLKCFYCKKDVLLMYEFVREPQQWTLERIDNKYGHTKDNTVIACLSCNLRRRTMHYERYIETKQMARIVKIDRVSTDMDPL
jgi:hypothetical protein